MKRYTFKYSAEPSSLGIVHRPVAYVHLQSKGGLWYLFYPYVDSGVDISLFPKSDASLLELSLYNGEYRPILEIGRVMLPAYVHNVKMRIGESVFHVDIAFVDSDEVPRLLGRAGVFKRFRVTFDESDLQTIFEPRE